MKRTNLLKSTLLLCALIVGSMNVWAADETITFSSKGYSDGTAVESVSGTNFTISFDKGSNANAPKYYSTGAAIRAYGGNTMTVSSATKTIASIVLTFGSGDGSNAITAGTGTYSSGTWTGSATSVTFTIGGTSGHRRIASVAVTYATGGGTDPTISPSTTSLTGFTYLIDNGPSDEQTFSVSGSNLTADINLSLGGSSNYEMSTTSGSGFTNSLTLTQTAGAVAATTIYVRLKADLSVGSYADETITLTSTGATNKTVTLSGSVEAKNFTWDLSTDKTTSASTTEMTWIGTYASMRVDKAGSSTNTNNYYPGTAGQSYTSTRFYKNSKLTIYPASGHSISKVVFTATTTSYASALSSSTWTNASASADGSTVTVTPTNGNNAIIATIGATCGFTAVKVYYEEIATVPITPAKTYTTLTSAHALDFTSVSSDLAAFIVKDTDASDGITLTQVNKVPSGTGLILKATTPGSAVNVPILATTADDMTGNKLAGSATATTAIAANGGYILSDGKFHPASAGDLPAGKAYLNLAVSAPVLEINFEGENGEEIVTGIENVQSSMFNVQSEYYNLNGQRVAQPTKGLYIVNGKKVVIK